MRKIITLTIIFCLLLSLMQGCGYYEDEQSDLQTDNIIDDVSQNDTELDIADLSEDFDGESSYEEPTENPLVLIDRIGYETEDKKIVLFIGEYETKDFVVREKKSNQIVFTGEMESQGFDKLTDNFVSKGDFSSVTKEGTYYIETADGRLSYAFCVKKDIYKEHYQMLMNSISANDIQTECKNVSELSRVIGKLLFTYDFYEDKALLNKAETEIKKLLECQNTDTGAVYKELQAQIVSTEATDEFAAVMAQFAYFYKEEDAELANQCLKAAEDAYIYSDNKESVSAAHYYAAAQLYRAKGSPKYHADIKEYLSEKESVSGNDMAEMDLYAAVVYLRTNYEVDKKLCDMLMERLRSEAEAIVKEADSDCYLACGGANRETDELLENLFLLSVVDYVIISYDYFELLKEEIHFLFGRNYASTYEEYSLLQKSAMLFVLGNKMKREENDT